MARTPPRLEQLALIEEAELRVFNDFLTKLKDSTEGDETLLDRTIVFYASNLGNGSGHSPNNLPILLAGGGFRHQGHVAFDRVNNRPLSNLFVRMMQPNGHRGPLVRLQHGSDRRRVASWIRCRV